MVIGGLKSAISMVRAARDFFNDFDIFALEELVSLGYLIWSLLHSGWYLKSYSVNSGRQYLNAGVP